MKASADVRLTMILERQDALRREAARARLATRPADGGLPDDATQLADDTTVAVTAASLAVPLAPGVPAGAVVPAASATRHERGSMGDSMGAALAASGAHAKRSSGDCHEGAVAA